MLVTNHVLSGAVIGAATRRVMPAFALGVLSHFALDAAPHWGNWAEPPTFLQVAVCDGLTGLAVMGTMTALAPPDERAAVLAGMAGAALPDLDKPGKIFFGRSPFPRLVDEIHMRIQDEAPHRLKYEVAAGAFMAAATVALLRGPLRRRAARLLRPGREPGLAGEVRCRAQRVPRKCLTRPHTFLYLVPRGEQPCSSPTMPPPRSCRRTCRPGSTCWTSARTTNGPPGTPRTPCTSRSAR